MEIIECVPNFSEGCKSDVIDAIAKSISDTNGCSLLFVDPGKSTNRTVYTFVGDRFAVVQGALNAARCAFRLINMEVHKGEHPRFGAMDVCPFIPVRNATMEDCVKCANQFAEKLSSELNVPVYLYGAAASCEERKILSNIRTGEYEKLPTKLQNPEWKPDYGPNTFVSTWGTTAVGARKFLIAYNVNLLATKEQAHKIALNIRETGRGKSKPGKFKCVQAIGWSLEEHNLVQVSVNITDTDVTKVHQVFEEVCKDAKELKIPVLGSEIIGLVPKCTLLDAAEFYIEQGGLFVLEEKSKIQLAVHKLGLNQLSEFNPDERVIEYIIKKNEPLTSLSLNKFISSVAERKSTPGGGSVSAAVAAMGTALCVMTGQLSYGKKKWEHVEPIMREHIPVLYRCMTELVPLVDRDSSAFDSYMKAMKLDANEVGEERKKQALQEGILEAINIPLEVMKIASRPWNSIIEIAKHGNMQCSSDIQVGARCLESGIWGAYQNVLINLPQVEDENSREEFKSSGQQLVDEAVRKCEEITNVLERRKNEST